MIAALTPSPSIPYSLLHNNVDGGCDARSEWVSLQVVVVVVVWSKRLVRDGQRR